MPISLPAMIQALEARGLVDGADFFVREQGAGTAYPPVAKYNEGTMICWFTIRALAQLDGFDVTMRIRDGLGDEHERYMDIFGRMPNLVLKARASYLASGTPTS